MVPSPSTRLSSKALWETPPTCHYADPRRWSRSHIRPHGCRRPGHGIDLRYRCRNRRRARRFRTAARSASGDATSGPTGERSDSVSLEQRTERLRRGPSRSATGASVDRTAVDSEDAIQQAPPCRSLNDQYRSRDTESEGGDHRHAHASGRGEEREHRNGNAADDPGERVESSDVSLHIGSLCALGIYPLRRVRHRHAVHGCASGHRAADDAPVLYDCGLTGFHGRPTGRYRQRPVARRPGLCRPCHGEPRREPTAGAVGH